MRTGPRTVLLALAERRESLARLREDPRCALTIVVPGATITAHGHATVAAAIAEGVVAVRIDVEEIQDHDDPRFTIDEGVRWRWTDPEADRRDAELRAALETL